MYDELVKRLRLCAEGFNCRKCDYENVPICKSLMDTEAADAIEELSRSLDALGNANAKLMAQVPEWIPVVERLPEDKKPVLVTYLGYYSRQPHSDLIACLYYGQWCYWDGDPCSYDDCKVEVTHWMPLPEPPKEEET